MKKLLPLILICLLWGCTQSNQQSTSGTNVQEIKDTIDNPFKMDSIHFADFYHQSDLNKQIRTADSTYWSVTDITERLRDSIYSEKGVVYFGVNRSMTNGNLNVNYFISTTNRERKDTITTYIGNHRFYQILSAMKFIRNKMNYYPEVPTDLNFMENDQLYIGATYEPKDSTWFAGMLVRAEKGKGEQRKIRLSPEKFDSLINKMDAMRTYLMK